jgi:hypothetical protein
MYIVSILSSLREGQGVGFLPPSREGRGWVAISLHTASTYRWRSALSVVE